MPRGALLALKTQRRPAACTGKELASNRPSEETPSKKKNPAIRRAVKAQPRHPQHEPSSSAPARFAPAPAGAWPAAAPSLLTKSRRTLLLPSALPHLLLQPAEAWRPEAGLFSHCGRRGGPARVRGPISRPRLACTAPCRRSCPHRLEPGVATPGLAAWKSALGLVSAQPACLGLGLATRLCPHLAEPCLRHRGCPFALKNPKPSLLCLPRARSVPAARGPGRRWTCVRAMHLSDWAHNTRLHAPYTCHEQPRLPTIYPQVHGSPEHDAAPCADV
jgi:hypothetical protein